MVTLSDILIANSQYARTYPEGLPTPPAQRLIILTCMDARIDPFRALGLAEGDAHVLRNAGGRVTPDVIRSFVLSGALLGTREALVIHHTECGLAGRTNATLHQRLRDDWNLDASGIDFLPFTDLDESVREDVAALRASPLLPHLTAIAGLVFDVQTGLLREVACP